MKAKLIKKGDGYYLSDISSGWWIGDTDHEKVKSHKGEQILSKLSLKNCQAIERGYDLDELAERKYPFDIGYGVYERNCQISDLQDAFLEGFQKALELMENEMKQLREFARYCAENWDCDIDKDNTGCRRCEAQTLMQQTEWDVEIEWEDVVRFKSSRGDLINLGEPKLDADGCLILKLKSE